MTQSASYCYDILVAKVSKNCFFRELVCVQTHCMGSLDCYCEGNVSHNLAFACLRRVEHLEFDSLVVLKLHLASIGWQW